MASLDPQDDDSGRVRRLRLAEEMQRAVSESNAPIGSPLESGFNYKAPSASGTSIFKGTCDNVGHHFRGKPVVYRDGVLVTTCGKCECRLVIEPFAGNFTAKRLSALITDAMVQDPPGRALVLLKDALAQFEQEQLDGANMIELAREAIDTIAKRV